MSGIDRRSAVFGGAAALGVAACGRAAPAGNLRLHPGRVLNRVPRDYCGFSVEASQLTDPGFYHPDNKGLIALHRRLGPFGVLRLGGNSSEFCWLRTAPDSMPPRIAVRGHGRADNWMPQRFYAITPQAVENMRGFLDACGWRCIWGLNFGTGSPDRNAEEAAVVAQLLGETLLYFQIGNEPDFYRQANNLLRPAGWDFPDYLNEWTAIADAISKKVPDARFGGPDVGATRAWVARFAHEAPKRVGQRLVGLSGHYYASGPPDAPHVTIANLLKPNDAAARQMAKIAPAARAANLSYRMSEGNSCYRGGKPGMSDAFASALWGADYMLAMAAHGCQGINFHGGPGAQIAISLGDKLPGAQSAADRARARLGAFYSPFAGSLEAGFEARPLFYGMMLVQRFADAEMIGCELDSGGVNAAAYAAKAGDVLMAAIVNKDASRDLALILDPGRAVRTARAIRLTAPALDATSDVRFAGSKIAHQTAAWQPRAVEAIAPSGGSMRFSVPRASAALVVLG